MRKRWTGFLAALSILISVCLPAILSADALAGGAEKAVLTIYYYAAGTQSRMVSAPYQAELERGSRYRVESPSAEPFVLADPGQAVVEGVLEEDTRIQVYYDDGRTAADYTVVYIGRDGENETVLARETFRAPAGETVNAEHREFENFGKEEGQDMTLLVTADGRAEKKIYYTRLFYDRIVFRTEGTYIAPIYGWAGQDISSETGKIEDPVRQGYIFKGWDREIPDVMPEGEYMVNAVWEPGESRYTVLRWMENAEDDGYTLLGETEVRTARTGSVATASQEDIDRAGMMADWFPDSDYYKEYYGFDYARCDDAEVTPDGRAVLNLYYDREIWTVNLHEEARHESGTSDSLLPNDDIWYTAQGKYGAPLPDDFPTMEEMEAYYMGRTQFRDVPFLGVRDEFEAVSRHLDTFYFQDLAAGNHTFDAYPWLEHDSYPVYVTYLKERADGTFRKVRMETVQIEKNPAVFGAEITVLHPKGLTCEGGWYTTGNSAAECEQKEKIPIRTEQIQTDGRCVFQNAATHLYVYMKRSVFTLNYIDSRSDGENVVYRTEDAAYRDEVRLDYDPVQDAEHEGDRFTGWYLSPALTDSADPLTTIRMPAEDVTVYAGWHPKEWTVRFDTLDGMAVQQEQAVSDGMKADMPEEPVYLAMEEFGGHNVRVNGRTLKGEDQKRWVDDCFDTVQIPSHCLKPGENEIEMSGAFNSETGLESIYLLGKFGVTLPSTIERLPKFLRQGDIGPQGLPFYSGSVIYHTGIRRKDVCVELQELNCALAVVRGGGEEKKYIVCAPYSAEISVKKELTIECVFTRRNTFGPHHNLPYPDISYPPACFVSEGANWTDDYVLENQGMRFAEKEENYVKMPLYNIKM